MEILQDYLSSITNPTREDLIQVCLAMGMNLPRWHKKVHIHKYTDFICKSAKVHKV